MEALRREVFERDGDRCQHILNRYPFFPFVVRCLKSITWDTGHLAHIISRGRGGKDVPENCLTKCAEHHMITEHCYGPSGQKPCPPKDKPRG